MFRVPDSLNMISSIFVYICEIKGVFFAMTNNSSVLLYLFRAQISSNLLGIIYEKKQEPTSVNVYFFRIIFILTRKNIIIINIPQSKYYVIILPYP
jgi:hypothetical protein